MTHSDQPPHPRAVEAWQSALQRGLEYLRAGEIDQADVYFERAYRLNPDCPEVCYALGRARLRQGEAERAESLLRKAWRGAPSLLSAAGTLARCLGLWLERFDDAHTVLDEAVAMHGSPPGLIHVVRAELLLEEQCFDRARDHAETALASSEPGSSVHAGASAALARLHNIDGLQAAEKGDNDRAIFSFKRAADLDPAWASPHINMGAAFAAMKRPERALRAYQQAVAIEPQSAAAHLGHGLLLHEMGQMDRACQALERALECDPSASRAVIALARAHLDAGAVAEAVDLLVRAVEANLYDPDLWTQLGVALLAFDAVDDAEASWRRAIDLDPQNREACVRLADLLARQARYQEAAVLAQRACDHSESAQSQQADETNSVSTANQNRRP